MTFKVILLGCTLYFTYASILAPACGEPAAEAASFDQPFSRAYEVEIRQRIVGQIDTYLERRTQTLAAERAGRWNRDLSAPGAYTESVSGNRERLKEIIGFVDQRGEPAMEVYGTDPDGSAVLADAASYTVQAVRWPVFGGIAGEGLLFKPKGRVVAAIVAIPDADQLPEHLAGWSSSTEKVNPVAAQLAGNGIAVLVPVLVSREARYLESGKETIPVQDWLPENRERRKLLTNLSIRETLWRQSFVMGRHLVGYELQRIAAALDWFEARYSPDLPLGLAGYGEGGLLALYGAAVDPRVDAVLVSGYFGPREALHEEPTERLIWKLLEEFGDAEIASLVLPRPVVIEYSEEPGYSVPQPVPTPAEAETHDWFQAMALKASAAGHIKTRPFLEVAGEVQRLRGLLAGGGFNPAIQFIHGPDGGTVGAWSPASLEALAGSLGLPAPIVLSGEVPPAPRSPIDATARQYRIADNLSAHLIQWGRDCDFDKYRFFQGDYSSPEAWDQSMEPYRKTFYEDIIGKLPEADEPPPINIRQRHVMETPSWSGFEVIYDALPGVWGFGILAVPKDIPAGGQRPLVVLQHGYDGMPGSYAKEGAYHNLMAQLCQRGFVVFAAHVPYHLSAKRAIPVGATVFSFGVPQYQQAIRWLKSLDFVDPGRMAYYGLSYGGLSALFIPPLVPEFKFAVSSCFFSSWPIRALNPEWTGSNLYHEAIALYKFGLGPRFGHAEMALMTAPRGFVVENGYFDTAVVTPLAAAEFAKVKRVYDLLGIGERAEWHGHIGGHETHADTLLPYLHRMLRHPVPPVRVVEPLQPL